MRGHYQLYMYNVRHGTYWRRCHLNYVTLFLLKVFIRCHVFMELLFGFVEVVRRWFVVWRNIEMDWSKHPRKWNQRFNSLRNLEIFQHNNLAHIVCGRRFDHEYFNEKNWLLSSSWASIWCEELKINNHIRQYVKFLREEQMRGFTCSKWHTLAMFDNLGLSKKDFLYFDPTW